MFLCLWPSLWSSCQSSWLQIQRSGFDSRRYQILWEVVGLERGPLSLVSIIEELLERKSIGSGLEIREYGRRDQSRWPRGTLYLQRLALTSPTSDGRSVGIDRSRTQATEFFLAFFSSVSIGSRDNWAGMARGCPSDSRNSTPCSGTQFLYSTESKPPLGYIYPHIEWIPGSLPRR
jgi:hypothetical protein